MPHLTLEYSTNLVEPLDPKAIFAPLHAALVEFQPIKLADIKSRVIPCESYYIGAGSPESVLIHLTVKILTGRSIEERRKMSQRMLGLLEEFFAGALPKQPCDITVDICEMERESYGKVVSPMLR
jgi:5-carboxymethyl-2-hydroxymuconate isomerase